MSENRNVRNGVKAGLAFFATVVALSAAHAAYTSMTDVTANQPLTKDLWNQMVANLNDLDARVTASSATPAFGMAYRTSVFDIAATNTWTDIPLNGGEANLLWVSHSTSTNPEKMTVAAGGTYRVTYVVHYRLNGAAHHTVTRVVKNGSTEVLGSFSETELMTDSNDTRPVHGEAIVSLAAGDSLWLQCGTNVNVTNEIDQYTYSTLPNPATRTYATLTVEKVGP